MSLMERDVTVRDLFDRVKTLELKVRDFAENSLAPADAVQLPEQPGWSVLSGWVVTGTTLQDVLGRIILDAETPMIQIFPSGYIQSADFISGVSGFQINGGTAEFNDVVVRGTIYATVGEIGGWTIAATNLSNNDATLSSTGYLLLGTGNNVVRLDAQDAGYRIWVGHAAGASAPFSVTPAGAVLATSGTVGGWTLGAAAFTGGDATLHNSGYLLLGTGDDIVRVDAADAVYRLWIGDAVAADAPFSVTKAGILKATAGTIEGLLTVGAAGPFIHIDGANKWIRTSNYVADSIGFNIDHLGNAEFNNMRVRGELRTSVLVFDELHATAGTAIVVKSASVLYADVTVIASPNPFNVDVKDPASGHAQIFAVGDILRMKDGSGDNWMTVDSVSDQATFYRYVCISDSGAVPTTFTAGAAVVDYGQAGDGGILQTADLTNAPYLDVFTHAGAPWATVTNHLRLGNINGLADYVADAYGIFIGDYAGDSWMAYDPGEGLRVHGDALIEGTVTTTKLAANTVTASRMLIGPGVFRPDNGVLLFGQPPRLKRISGIPYWETAKGALGTFTGGLHPKTGPWIGSVGYQFELAATNKVTNPSFETNTTTWANDGTNTIARSTDQSRFGSYSLKCTYQDHANLAYYNPITLTAVAHTFSAWLWIPSNFDGTNIQLEFIGFVGIAGGGAVNADMAKRDRWQRVETTGTPAGGDLAGLLLIRTTGAPTAGRFIYVDGVQCEALGVATSYVDGTLGYGYVWTGAAHASTSTRAVSWLNLALRGGMVSDQDTLSFRVVCQAPYDHDATWLSGANSYIWDLRGADDDNRIILRYNAPAETFEVFYNAAWRTVSAAQTFSAGDWLDIVVTIDYDAGTSKLYVNGALEDIDAAFTAPTAVVNWGVGSSYAGTLQSGWTIAEYAVFSDILTLDEVSDMYQMRAALVDFGADNTPGILLTSQNGDRMEITPSELAVWENSVKAVWLDEDGLSFQEDADDDRNKIKWLDDNAEIICNLYGWVSVSDNSNMRLSTQNPQTNADRSQGFFTARPHSDYAASDTAFEVYSKSNALVGACESFVDGARILQVIATGMKLFGNLDFTPDIAGQGNLGTAALYWNEVNYKVLNDRGCLILLGVDLKRVDSEETLTALESILAIVPSDKVSSRTGKFQLDYRSFPELCYSPAPIATEDVYEQEERNREGVVTTPSTLKYKAGDKMGEDGIEIGTLVSVIMDSIKELSTENDELAARIVELEKAK